ncbi:unnamed protein product [Paramecium pentaurelia]|uniref:Major facilitator superfamily (MFS) profile domain-containing protein n=1 Tax=Paramecium pentaurelia TaxID=43138 RepID=A0A8S1TDL8_9CILI|nr:unnamed protein product [Paramecium pentaurelia]
MKKQKKQISWHRTNIRWLFLGMTCLFQVGCCICIDFPSVLASQIQSTFNVGQKDINYLFSIYSMPNIVLPFFGGLIIDKIGVKSALLIFCSFLVIGQGLCVQGAYDKDFNLLKLGMLFLGIGGEVCLTVAQSALLTKWFLGQEMSLAFGVQITFIRVGSVIGANWLPKVYIQYGDSFTACMIFCFIFILITMLTSFIQCMLDNRSDKRDREQMSQQEISELEQQPPVNCRDVKEFKLDYYLLSISCVFSYSAFLILQANGIRMFQIRYNLTISQQTFLYSLPYFISASVTPIIGYFIDQIGKRPIFLIISGNLLLLSTIIYSKNVDCSIEDQCFSLVLLAQLINGIFFALYAPVIWPCIPICVNANSQGTGFGIIGSIQNAGLTIFPIIVGRILFDENPISYQYMIYFLGFITIIANISNINIYFYDIYHDNKLMSPSIKLPEYEVVDEQEESSDNTRME